MGAVFSQVRELILKWEGGFVNNPQDPGGMTKYGISKKYYPKVDIEKLTLDDALAIYKRDFWDKYVIGAINDQVIANQVFLLTINTGAPATARIVQNSLNSVNFPVNVVKVDGVMGVQTIYSVNTCNNLKYLSNRIRIEAINHYLSLIDKNEKLEKYLKGWIRRALS